MRLCVAAAGMVAAGLPAGGQTSTAAAPEFEVAKGGPKLTAFRAGGTNVSISRGQLTVQGGGDNTMVPFAAELAKIVGRVVVNKTGILGRYDVALSWTPDALSGGSDAMQDGPSIFTALQEQLGLKLESAKGPVPVLVADEVAMPSENCMPADKACEKHAT